MKKLKSLTIFFPFMNDAGTVAKQINDAYKFGSEIASKLEVIAIHGGKSNDNTYDKILEMQKLFPDLKIIDKSDNTEGYAVIKHGFYATTMEWVFYTDGDAQYHLDELAKLVKCQDYTKADIVNGYKKSRGDHWIRKFLGDMYKKMSVVIFRLPVRDTDCDFRLIRNSLMQKIKLESKNSSILPELLIKLKLAGAKFAEVEVNHYHRIYGRSNYRFYNLLKEKLIGDCKLFMKYRSMVKEFRKVNRE